MRPSTSDLRYVNIYDVVNELLAVSDIGERWISRGQLVCEAAIGPDINSFVVLDAIVDLWCYPIRSSFLRLALVLLFMEETSESQVSDFYVTVFHRMQDIVRLDIPMQNIVIMHLLEAKSRFV